MKFNIGEKVRLRANDRVGVIRRYLISGKEINGVEKEEIKYEVNLGNYYENWFTEDQLQRYDDYYKVSDQFEIGLADMMIDINLVKENIHMVKNFFNIKQSFGSR
jgi:hypothetical protein